MKLRDIFSTGAILPALTATNREAALLEMLNALAGNGSMAESDIPDVLASVLYREANGSTGIGRGVAVPHSRHPSIVKMSGSIGIAPAGIDFSSLDGQPVFSIVLVLSPAHDQNSHLTVMNIIFNNLQRDGFRKLLRNSVSVEQIVELLDEADAGR